MTVANEVLEIVRTRGRIIAREFAEDNYVCRGRETTGGFTDYEFSDGSVIRISADNVFSIGV